MPPVPGPNILKTSLAFCQRRLLYIGHSLSAQVLLHGSLLNDLRPEYVRCKNKQPVCKPFALIPQIFIKKAAPVLGAAF